MGREERPFPPVVIFVSAIIKYFSKIGYCRKSNGFGIHLDFYIQLRPRPPTWGESSHHFIADAASDGRYLFTTRNLPCFLKETSGSHIVNSQIPQFKGTTWPLIEFMRGVRRRSSPILVYSTLRIPTQQISECLAFRAVAGGYTKRTSIDDVLYDHVQNTVRPSLGLVLLSQVQNPVPKNGTSQPNSESVFEIVLVQFLPNSFSVPVSYNVYPGTIFLSRS